MASLLSAVVLLSCLLSGFAYAVAETDFDFFALALEWPATSCSINSKTCCPYNGCCPGGSPPPGFTIRGLWPDYNDGSYPSCCEGPAYDETKCYGQVLDDTKLQNDNFMHQKETEKHGTCATSVIPDQQEYFLTALQLYLKYNVTDVLVKAGYKPSSKTYPLTGIVSAIESAFNTKPQITCNDKNVYQLRLCFTKEFEVRESCAGESTSCPEYVSLPKFAFRNVTKAAEIDWFSTIKSVVS
ncbi:hypothetical protein M8C21_010280 [Ambrosia artemisiifolia]|uniref:Uncharacterized protein n=1 Tax=Ambrosia artemisiifolia TaxID=4212 RepID=A0AAD5CBL4_AMBAR|nr:hypothetical protein M8C21_010280 [Ambrosia artemisiifolia]